MPRAYTGCSESFKTLIAGRAERWRTANPEAPSDSELEAEAVALWEKPVWEASDRERWDWFMFYREDLTPTREPRALINLAYGPEKQLADSGQSREWIRRALVSFNEFKAPNQHYMRLRESARGWFDQWTKGQAVKGMFFYGQPGSGKTFLLQCLMTAMAQRGARFAWIEIGPWIDRIKRTFREQADWTEDDIFDQAARAVVLFADDLGKGRETEFTLDYVQRLFDERHRRGALTFCTSNLGVTNGELEAFVGDRIFSRMHDMFQFVGPFPQHDWRRSHA